jgi:hypothetical protein
MSDMSFIFNLDSGSRFVFTAIIFALISAIVLRIFEYFGWSGPEGAALQSERKNVSAPKT